MVGDVCVCVCVCVCVITPRSEQKCHYHPHQPSQLSGERERESESVHRNHVNGSLKEFFMPEYLNSEQTYDANMLQENDAQSLFNEEQ